MSKILQFGLVPLALLSVAMVLNDVVNDVSTVGAVGVFTPCGIAAIIEIKGDGSMTMYDVDNQASAEKLQELVALPENKRIEIAAGCPFGMNNGQEQENRFEAQGDVPDGDGRQIA